VSRSIGGIQQVHAELARRVTKASSSWRWRARRTGWDTWCALL